MYTVWVKQLGTVIYTVRCATATNALEAIDEAIGMLGLASGALYTFEAAVEPIIKPRPLYVRA